MTNMAVRQKLLDKKLTVTLQIWDLLNTSKRESTSEGPGFYSYSMFDREAPMVFVTLSYNFHNYKQKRDNSASEDDSGGMDEGF